MIVNGTYFSFVDLVINFDGLQLSAVKSINYKDSLGRNYVRGTSPIPLGLTTGKYEASFDMEIFLPSVPLITVNPGWRQVPHVCTIAYGPNVVAPLPFTIDTIAGIWLKELDNPNSDSEDGITRKFAGMVTLPILYNGVPSIIWPSTIGAVG
jgi:hypothetical protein